MISSIEITKPDMSFLLSVKDYVNDVFLTMLPDQVDYISDYVSMVKRANLNPIPHISVRNMRSIGHIQTALSKIGTFDILLIGGDRDKGISEVHSLMEVIESGALEFMSQKRVGIAGFPDGFEHSSDQLMFDKIEALKSRGIAPYIVTQFCFDAEIIENWVYQVRQHTDCEIKIGIAGPMNILSLINLALKCGVGNSIRALQGQQSLLTNSYKSYRPERLLQQLQRVDNIPNTSFHLFAIGGRDKTAKWLMEQRGVM